MAKLSGALLNYSVTAACGAGFLLFGYDQGVFGGLLSNQVFLRQFNNPNSTIQGQIVATYDIGCIIGTILSILVGDKLGRRRSILIGCAILIVGAILQTSSYGLAQMIVGRVVAGIGNGMNTVAIPIWQSEIAKPKSRGKLIVLQLVTNIFGIVITNWMNFGFTYVPNNPISWRFPLGFQLFFALITVSMVLIAPESPRWLVLVDRPEEAQDILAALRSKTRDDALVIEEIDYLVSTVRHEHATRESVSIREVFSGGKTQNFRRVLLGAGTPFFQQVGGTNVIAYYLPVVLVRSFGMTDRMALMLSAVDSMSLMFWGGMAALVIDRIGRKRLMLMGAGCSGICFALVAVGLRFSDGSKAWSIMAVVFIFMYYVSYGMSFLSIPYMYPAEINTQRLRNIGTSLATAVNWLFVYVIVVITPMAIENIGWRYYLIFAIFNFCFIPIIMRWYVETAGLSLEQVDRLFEIKYEGGKSISWKKATALARQETPVVVDDKKEADVEHAEYAAGDRA